jgi:hypothetical protein
MYNATNGIRVSGNNVYFPLSDKPINAQELEKKIEKAQNHIRHLEARIPHRTTHGGKTFRAKCISLKDQVAVTKESLIVMEIAQKKITVPSPVNQLAAKTHNLVFGLNAVLPTIYTVSSDAIKNLSTDPTLEEPGDSTDTDDDLYG